jgi:hypothetical protein
VSLVFRVIRGVGWILLTAAVLIVASCTTHPWFKSRFPWEDPPDPDQQPILVNSSGERYHPGTPSWVPLVDNCIREGGGRADCIDQLPPDEKAKFHQWEQERRSYFHEMGTSSGLGYERLPDHQIDSDGQ